MAIQSLALKAAIKLVRYSYTLYHHQFMEDLSCVKGCSKCFPCGISFTFHDLLNNTIITLHYYKKLEMKKSNYFAHNYTASAWQNLGCDHRVTLG